MPQKNYKPHYEHLKSKWLDQQKELQRNLAEKHGEAFDWINKNYKHLVVGSLGSLVMLSHPVTTSITVNQERTAPSKKEISSTEKKASFADLIKTPVIDPRTRLVLDLSYLLPETVQPLTEEQEKVIARTLGRHFNIPVSAELQGKKLNRSYGIIGAEQHLMRYPGDTMATHFSNPEDARKYYSSGMAPGRGAWGYFAYSRNLMTQLDVAREKYYIAVQTFLVPDYNLRVKEYSDFFKFRKMLVVNPENGKAMVVVIGDAGPASWTGKHLGGSPEVMSYLERKDGKQKGPVLYFFIDDPDDTIPLGPIETNELTFRQAQGKLT